MRKRLRRPAHERRNVSAALSDASLISTKSITLSNRILFITTLFIAVTAVAIAAWAGGTELPGPLEAGWQGEPVCELLHEDQRQRMLRCTFPPGVGHDRHYHRPHMGYTLAGGRMQITDANGTRVVDAKTGGYFVSDGVEWHEPINVGDTTAQYLIIEVAD